jgi:squalene synthase HpnC
VVNVSSNRSHADNRSEASRNALISLAEAELFCRRLAKSHYENFLVATVFLPRRLRQPFFNVYAFCRSADDLADESSSPEVATRELHHFQNLLDEAFAGRPSGEIFVALAHTATQFDLSQEPFNRLLSAFRQDQTKTRYDTRAELREYCHQSANPVGEILLRLCGCLSPETLPLSNEVCTGLQLINFWQDVKRDFAIGRIYLPRETMSRFAVNEEDLRADLALPQLRQAIEAETELAEQCLRRGLPLAEMVPPWFARDVLLFVHGGLAVAQAIRKQEFDVMRTRPIVAKRTQFGLLAKAWLGRLGGQPGMI